MYNKLYKEWAAVLEKEITEDQSEWFHPTGQSDIFAQARQKFMTQNLNCYSVKNMLATSVEPEVRNPNLPKCYEFAELVRQSHSEYGPFGKMAVWKVDPGMKLLPHRDNFGYHHNIYRVIFNISDHADDVEILMDNKRVEVECGSVFPFFPATTLHSFINNSDRIWYFLAFDIWDKEKRDDLLKVTDLSMTLNDLSRLNTVGNQEHKTLSRH